MLTTSLIIYIAIFCILYFKMKIDPSKCVSPIYAIPEKFRKFAVIIAFTCVGMSLFIDGLTYPIVLLFLGLSYLIEFLHLKTHKAKYYALLNTFLFVVLFVSNFA